MEESTGKKLSNPKGMRLSDAQVDEVEAYRRHRSLEKFSHAQREIFNLGLATLRGETAEILDAVRVVREAGLDPLEVLRGAQERALAEVAG